MLEAGPGEDSTWQVPAFELDFVDVTRQVMANAFNDMYQDQVDTFDNSQIPGEVADKGDGLLDPLDALDEVLSTIETELAGRVGEFERGWVYEDVASLGGGGQGTLE